MLNKKLFFPISLWLLSSCSLPSLMLLKDPLTGPEHAALAHTYAKDGEHKLALKEYQLALSQDPKSLALLMGAGNAAFELKDYKGAGKYFRKALKVNPEDAGANNNLAMVYLATGKLSKAKGYAQKALIPEGPIRPYALDTLEQIEKAALLKDRG